MGDCLLAFHALSVMQSFVPCLPTDTATFVVTATSTVSAWSDLSPGIALAALGLRVQALVGSSTRDFTTCVASSFDLL